MRIENNDRIELKRQPANGYGYGNEFTPYKVLYMYVYTSGLYLFNCGRGQKGVYPGKTRFRKYRFRGITYMSTLLPLLAENRSRVPLIYGSPSCIYINGCAQPPFQTKSCEFTLALLTGTSGGSLSAVIESTHFRERFH